MLSKVDVRAVAEQQDFLSIVGGNDKKLSDRYDCSYASFHRKQNLLYSYKRRFLLCFVAVAQQQQLFIAQGEYVAARTAQVCSGIFVAGRKCGDRFRHSDCLQTFGRRAQR